MRVLIDECVDPRLSKLFPADFLVNSVVGKGWAGKKNGELVRAAAIEFDVLFTVDQNMRFQTSLKGVDLCVVVAPHSLKTVTDFQASVDDLFIRISEVEPGTFLLLNAPR